MLDKDYKVLVQENFTLSALRFDCVISLICYVFSQEVGTLRYANQDCYLDATLNF